MMMIDDDQCERFVEQLPFSRCDVQKEIAKRIFLLCPV